MKLHKKPLLGEFDITKAIAILFLPFVHFVDQTGYEYGFVNIDMSEGFEIIKLLTIFGPSVFMICMGVRIQKNITSKRLIHNGIQFLIIGYLLNFFIDTVPYLINAFITGSENNVMNLIDMAIQNLLSNDIYVFVGWFFIFYGFLKKIFKNLTMFKLLCVASAMLLLNTYMLNNVNLDYSTWSQFIGSFVSVNDQSYFPLAAWTIFVFIGMALRNYLNVNDYKIYQKQMTKVMIVGIGGFLIFSVTLFMYYIMVIDIFKQFVFSYWLDILAACALILLAASTLGIISKIYYFVRNNPLENLLLRISTFIMSYYILQWLIVALVTTFFILFFNTPGVITIEISIVIMILIFVICVVLTLKYGYQFTKFVLKVTDYKKWFKKKSTSNK